VRQDGGSEPRKYAEKALAGRDVEVACGEVVESVTPTQVTLKSGRVIPAHTLVWGAGLQANPIATALGLKLQKGGVPRRPVREARPGRELRAPG
jgi:NADH dehydrogenase